MPDVYEQYEEQVELVVRTLPNALWRIYSELIVQGFADDDALILVEAHIDRLLGLFQTMGGVASVPIAGVPIA